MTTFAWDTTNREADREDPTEVVVRVIRAKDGREYLVDPERETYRRRIPKVRGKKARKADKRLRQRRRG